MTILNDTQIMKAIEQARLQIVPLLLPIQPTSVDLRLGPGIRIPSGGMVDPRTGYPPGDRKATIGAEGGYILMPGASILAATLEHLVLGPTIVGILTGKSTLARIFLQVECAGYVDPGWEGNLTIELTNLGPYRIVLYRGMPIAQIRFELVDPPAVLYGDEAIQSHYAYSIGPERAKFSLVPASDPPAPHPVSASVVVPDPYR